MGGAGPRRGRFYTNYTNTLKLEPKELLQLSERTSDEGNLKIT